MNPNLDPRYAEVFDDPRNGTPDDITQAGCLALARLGQDAWNAWYKLFYPREIQTELGMRWKNCVDFSNVDFTEENNLVIDFQGFRFRNQTNFSKAKFFYSVSFEDAQFDDYVSFDGAQFRRKACFVKSKFNGFASFRDTVFESKARFGGIRCISADFSNTKFCGNTYFSGAQFAIKSGFINTEFNGYTSYEGAQFGDDTSFDGAVFSDEVNFRATDWTSLRRRYNDINEAQIWAESYGLSPDRFRNVSFMGVTFGSDVDFSGRIFSGRVSFAALSNDLFKNKSTIFCKAPIFHNCKLNQDISFDRAIFTGPSSYSCGDESQVRAYRTLKLAFSQQQAFREEQKFFLLELAEEEKLAPKRHRWLFIVYKWISNYGFSIARPVLLLTITNVVFLLGYSVLIDSDMCFEIDEKCKFNYELLEFTLLQSFPFPGFDKWTESIRSNLYTETGFNTIVLILMTIIHKGISFLVFFLIGLALRNLFKMK